MRAFWNQNSMVTWFIYLKEKNLHDGMLLFFFFLFFFSFFFSLEKIIIRYKYIGYNLNGKSAYLVLAQSW